MSEVITCNEEGETFKGELKEGLPNGQGEYHYANGDRYIGEYKDGKKHGYGVYTFALGGSYEGDYSEGQKHGKGILKSDKGVYTGDFHHGLFSGHGEYRLSLIHI
eukprot:TRINITY_DN6661_c0_g1_i2.p1 TRINITY_DN6661_c0_g1~~TRINITY_DN6661_c0_g1_i2.p1  ORF type:complete len:114 (-),score=30.03 TRINITY_DN6661_c0_g1_i2:24-338(-)